MSNIKVTIPAIFKVSFQFIFAVRFVYLQFSPDKGSYFILQKQKQKIKPNQPINQTNKQKTHSSYWGEHFPHGQKIGQFQRKEARICALFEPL